jgi:D-lactate dehydrogenase
MCQVACPVRINTGDLVKRLRAEEASPVLATAWNAAARMWGPVTAVASAALDVVPRLPSGPVRGANALARTVLGDDTVPEWSAELPRGGRRRRRRAREHPTEVDAVYFPACVSAMFGAAEGAGVQDALLVLAERAGVSLQIPSGIDGLCCGTPWSSKGYLAGRDQMRERLAAALAPLTDGGRLPVVVDASSCTEGVRHALGDDPRFRVVDAITFARETLFPRLPSPRRVRLAAVHPTCSTTRLGTTPDLLALAGALADEVRVPDSWACCGFAGDRGMLHPELTASATRAQAEEVGAMGADVHLSSNRTCELGMTRATGSAYRHVLEVLEEATRPGHEHT